LSTIDAILDEHGPPLRLWTLAAVAAVALHVGGVAIAYVHLNADQDVVSFGSDMPGIGIEVAAPSAEETDLPVGPQVDASVASPALAEQKAEIKPTELPREKPTDDEADRVVTLNETKKPTENDPKIETVQTAASQESVASEASAPRPMKTVAPVPTGRKKGIGDDNDELTAEWSSQLNKIFERHKKYPKGSRLKDGSVKVSFTVDRLGHVVQLSILESSGDIKFDEEALEMIRRSEKDIPRPKFELTQDTATFNLPVNFKGPK
jgi:periplasmic protein TonB